MKVLNTKISHIMNVTNMTILTALTLSTVAAWFAVTGLIAIFPAKATAIAIMGGAIECAKVISVIWLRKYWSVASWQLKIMIIPMVIIAMMLTSLGTFGYLSAAHSEQGAVSGDIAAKLSIYDEKIKIAKENIDVNRRALKQMDEAVDQAMGRTTTEAGADKAVQIRRSQGRERTRLLQDIDAEQKKISALMEERAPLAAQNRKIEAEVGPIKYIAALIYNETPDQNTLERAVRWVIILLVFVFDPFAIALVLAGNASKNWRDPEIVEKTKEEVTPILTPEVDPVVSKPKIEDIEGSTPWPTEWETHVEDTPKDSEKSQDDFDIKKHPYLFRGGFGFKESVPMVANPPAPITESPKAEEIITEPQLAEQPTPVELPRPHLGLVADNEGEAVSSSFGTQFPRDAKRGDVFVRVDMLPNRVYKYDGESNWIEINKKTTDTYMYDEAYILYLIEKLDRGEYDVDLLTENEKDQIRAYLRTVNSKSNILGDSDSN